MRAKPFGALAVIVLTFATAGLSAQQPSNSKQSAVPGGATAAALPPGYVIGASDLLSIVFWRDKDMSAEVTVRPDGKISLPLLNEINAAGSTPEELRARITTAAGKFVADPDVTVVVREIRSRIVFITGSVARPAGYPLNGEMTVLQLIAVSGGLLEFAKSKDITIVRTENGQEHRFKFNYKDVVSQKRTTDNIVLKPGDTVVVP
jgi:polysaccharide biosynthesis/export protein